jgi:hypothetical protein
VPITHGDQVSNSARKVDIKGDTNMQLGFNADETRAGALGFSGMDIWPRRLELFLKRRNNPKLSLEPVSCEIINQLCNVAFVRVKYLDEIARRLVDQVEILIRGHVHSHLSLDEQ